MTRNIVLSIGISVLLWLSMWNGGGNAFAQGGAVRTFTLPEAQKYAVERHLTLKNSQLDIEIARSRVRELKAIGLPQVNGTARYLYNIKLPAQLVPADLFGFPSALPVLNDFDGDPATSDYIYFPQDTTNNSEFTKLTFGTKNNLNFGLEASQLLFDGSYLLGLKAAELYVEQAEKSALKTESDIKNNVRDAYLAALLIQENIAIVDKNIEVLNKTLYEVSEMQKAGFVEQLDVDRLQLTASNLQVQRQTLQRSADLLLDVLQFQMGMSLTDPIELTDRLESFLAEADALLLMDYASLWNEADKKRIESQLLQLQNTFREMEIKQIKLKYYPSVAAFSQANLSYQGDNFNVFKKDKWISSMLVGLQVNVPIYDGGSKKAQLAQKTIIQQQSFNQEKFFKQGLQLELSQAQSKLKTARENLKDQANNVELAQRIYDTTLIKYRTGVGSSLEITDAESKLYQTQGLYLQAMYDVGAAKSALEKALGR